jgi:hypothetical protein
MMTFGAQKTGSSWWKRFHHDWPLSLTRIPVEPLPQSNCRFSGLSGLGIRAGIDEMVASSRMNHYEQGKHEPDFGAIHRITDAPGTSAAYFFCDDDAVADVVWEMTHPLRG